ncbi:mitochondrial carrier domain-containing protein [Lipomyces oligophaga]|uniref:mitochondrial carrier domain-containing protein n=1 Tax=Lipomyces oligophaga TaxID=45792 RepID=UPI0034CF4943
MSFNKNKADSVNKDTIAGSDCSKETSSTLASTVSDISQTETIVCGAVAGLTSRFFVAPLDVVKIRLQLQTNQLNTTSSSKPVYRGLFPTIYKIYREEGLTSLWRGNLPAEILYLIYGAAQFASFRQANVFLVTNSPALPEPLANFIAGAVAGGVATLVSYPLDLLRTRFAAQGTHPDARAYYSLRHAIGKIIRDEGYKGLFRGIRPALSQIIPQMGFFFATYVPCQTLFSKTDHINFLGSEDALAGIMAGIISKAGVFPLDVLRKRLQVQGPTRNMYALKNIPDYPNSMLACASMIIQTEGVRGLYRGLGVSLIKNAPTSAITMWTFEQCVQALRWAHTETAEFKA